MLVGGGGQHYVQERWLIPIGSHDIGRLVAMEAADPETLLLYAHMAAVQARQKNVRVHIFGILLCYMKLLTNC